MVYDGGLRRVSLLGPDGDFAVSYPFQELVSASAGPLGALDERSLFVVQSRPRGVLARAGPSESVLDFKSVTLATGAVLPIPGVARRLYYSVEFQPPNAPFLSIPFPLAPRTHYASGHGLAVFGHTSTLGCRVCDGAGKLRLVASVEHDPLPVGRDEREWARLSLENRSKNPAIQRAVRRAWSDMALPDHLPAFGRTAWEVVPSPKPRAWSILIDAVRNVWLLSYVPNGSPRPWLVFDSEGHWLGRVTVPDDLVPLEIGHDHVLGWAEQSDDLIVIRMHRLVKS